MRDLKTPALDLLRERGEEARTVLKFLEDSQLELAEWIPCLPSFHGSIEEFSACIEMEHLAPVKSKHQDLVFKHFGIDIDKVEKERRELLSCFHDLEPEGEAG